MADENTAEAPTTEEQSKLLMLPKTGDDLVMAMRRDPKVRQALANYHRHLGRRRDQDEYLKAFLLDSYAPEPAHLQAYLLEHEALQELAAEERRLFQVILTAEREVVRSLLAGSPSVSEGDIIEA